MADRPTHHLMITDKENIRRKTRAGVLFTNNKSLGLVLGPGIVLRAEDQDKYYFTFWPVNSVDAYQMRFQKPAEVTDDPVTDPTHDSTADDIPF